MSDVSVVIPVRNDARRLERCLQALARQSVAPREVVVVDNASSDDSVAVALAYGARVVTESSVGIPAAAAAGYDAAFGSVIARLDADSVPPQTWVEHVVSALDRRPGTVAVSGVGVFHDAPRGLGHLLSLAYLGSYYALGLLAAGHHVLWGSSMAIRRDAWQQVSAAVHRDDRELHDDMDLALVLGPAARIDLVPSITVGVSVRSLQGAVQRRRRLARALRTLAVNWQDIPPWQRWARTLTRPDRRPLRKATT